MSLSKSFNIFKKVQVTKNFPKKFGIFHFSILGSPNPRIPGLASGSSRFCLMSSCVVRRSTSPKSWTLTWKRGEVQPENLGESVAFDHPKWGFNMCSTIQNGGLTWFNQWMMDRGYAWKCCYSQEEIGSRTNNIWVFGIVTTIIWYWLCLEMGYMVLPCITVYPKNMAISMDK